MSIGSGVADIVAALGFPKVKSGDTGTSESTVRYLPIRSSINAYMSVQKTKITDSLELLMLVQTEKRQVNLAKPIA